MECEGHNYKTPVHLRISGFLSMAIPSVLVAIVLPEDTNFVLGVFLLFCVIIAMDVLHFRFIERPYIAEWLIKHMEKYHMDK